MSIYSGPEIIGGNLMLYYDIKNTDRSWKGKPTTNFISNPTEEMTRGEFGQYRDLAPIFDTNGLVPYSLSMDIKVNKPGSVYVYMQNGSSSKYGFVATSVSATTEYQRFYFNNITPFISTPSDTVAMLATYTTYGSGVNPTVKNIQLELGSFSTPFVNGTRSNTQAILDLTGRNTIAANSLTYSTNNVFSFDGTNNFLTAGPDTNIISGNQISVEAWVRTNVNGVYKKIFTNGSAVGVYLSLGPAPNNIYFGVVTNGTSAFTGSATSLSTTSYSHLVGTYNGSAVSLYLNGTLLSSTAASGTISTGATTYISGYPSGGERWDGAIDAIKVYNRALSASEVTQNFVAMRGRYGI